MSNTPEASYENGQKAERPRGSQAATALTPLMQQYRDIKAGHPGTILFFRLGDFYEMFSEDAVKASPILEVVLTKRQGIPMCGVPYHSVNSYIKKLVKAGEKVAVCEQLETPGQGKGIVRRGVVRVITAGTLTEDTLLDARSNNFLTAVCPSENGAIFGLASADISTGEFISTEVARDKLKDELFRINPGEIVAPETLVRDPFFAGLCSAMELRVTPYDDWRFSPAEGAQAVKTFFKLQSLKPLGMEDKPRAAAACGAALSYLENTRSGANAPLLSPVRYYSSGEFLILDESAVKNLEIVEGLSSHTRDNSLLECVDQTLTPMGARALKQWLLKPLLSRSAINDRQAAVGFFIENGILRKTLREKLSETADIERILSRLSSFSAGPKELIALKHALAILSGASGSLLENGGILPPPQQINSLASRLTPPDGAAGIISSALNDDPPASLKDGGVLRDGFLPELDELRRISRESRKLVSDMEQEERARTGIGSLKIGYTSVFGYYIEVSKTNLHLVRPEYIRKQTVASGERFITPELKDFENKILSAQERITALEDSAYRKVCGEIMSFADRIRSCAAAAAELDIYLSFAETAALRGYVKPAIDEGSILEIKDGRHPVVENRLKSGSFVANDIHLDGESEQIMLLTGPNMAGKSTYLRQTALIVILAQAGSYVPCSSARVGIVDRIFTRIGSGDNLSGGESTFMVEMHETANILNQHTAGSLIILDEVGRGTSTYDGMSIAWAALEHLSKSRDGSGRGPKVLFATHYFELTDLEGSLGGVKNYNVSVKEWRGDVIFLHKIVPGAADRSYGIHVAKLAGLPQGVIERAYGILSELERKPALGPRPADSGQLDLFALPSPKFMIELGKIDIDTLTPLEALQTLARWKNDAEAAENASEKGE